MHWPSPDEEPAVRSVILSDDIAATREAICWARGKEAKVGAGVWMWRTDGSRTDYGRVGAAAVCKHRDGWKSFRSHLGTGRMEVYHAELWAIILTLPDSVKKRDILQANRVAKVAVFSDSQRVIRRTEHLELGSGQPLAMMIICMARAIREVGLETEIHWVLGQSSIPGNEEADRQANLAREGQRAVIVQDQLYTSAAIRTRQTFEARSVAKVQWEANKCSKHCNY